MCIRDRLTAGQGHFLNVADTLPLRIGSPQRRRLFDLVNQRGVSAAQLVHLSLIHI